jgi:hypothetical protein
MNNLETPTPTSSTHKGSTVSQQGPSLPDQTIKGLKEPLTSVNEGFPKELTIQEKESLVGHREPARNSKIGQQVLAIRRASFSHTHEIASSDFDTLQHDIVSTFEMADLDD